MAATRGDRGKTGNAGALIARGGCYYDGTGENPGNADAIIAHGYCYHGGAGTISLYRVTLARSDCNQETRRKYLFVISSG